MKYRHAFHAGNFADVHKHVTLLALLDALKRKDKGFLYLETHAGRGLYDLSGDAARTGRAAASGVERAVGEPLKSDELRRYAECVARVRSDHSDARIYPGSPLIAASSLRPQDRAILIELLPGEAGALTQTLRPYPQARVECGNGFELLRAHLPPVERRGLILIDPPYEETREDFDQVARAIADALRRFETGVIAAWYPIKDQRHTDAWLTALARGLKREALVSELWLYPCDSEVALNGSGLLIVNPPYQLAERMQSWLPELRERLDVNRTGGANVRTLGARAKDQ
jgi:23S rRNA (adenine2030-N6)-methyltransferase